MKKVIIMGCGRTGGQLANLLDAAGHSVTVMDVDAYSFRRLSPDYKGQALVGNGTDMEVLKKAGIAGTEVFIAVTQGDNRNIMAAEMAKNIFNVPRVICRIYDPLREEIFKTLGLETICPTTILADILKKRVEG
jgi:K+ transport systems, NAD-binding component